MIILPKLGMAMVVLCSLSAPIVYALTEGPVVTSDMLNKAGTSTIIKNVKISPDTGTVCDIEVYKDATGGSVIHFLDQGVGPGYMSKTDQQKEFDYLNTHPEAEINAAEAGKSKLTR